MGARADTTFFWRRDAEEWSSFVPNGVAAWSSRLALSSARVPLDDFFGAGRHNLLADRDYFATTLKYSF